MCVDASFICDEYNCLSYYDSRGADRRRNSGTYHPYTSVFNNNSGSMRGKSNGKNRRGLGFKRKFDPPASLHGNGGDRSRQPGAGHHNGKNYNNRNNRAKSNEMGSSRSRDRNSEGSNEEHHSELCEHEKLRGFDPHLIENIEKEILNQCQKIAWDDIAGLKDAKSIIKEVRT